MTKGILFYSNNEYPIPLLLTAMHSLRKYYDGDIHVVFGKNTPNFFKKICRREKYKGITFANASKRHYSAKTSNPFAKEWYEKPYIIHYESPFDLTQYYDCDHVFFKHFDTSIFDLIEEHNLITSAPIIQPRKHVTIKKDISMVTGHEIEFLNRVNGGCVGYKNSSNLVEMWIDYLNTYRTSKELGRSSKVKYNAEEFGLATTINTGHGCIIDEKWSHCNNKNVIMTDQHEYDAIHFVAQRWQLGDLWKNAFKEAYEDNFFRLQQHFKRYCSCNEFTNRKEVQNYIKGN